MSKAVRIILAALLINYEVLDTSQPFLNEMGLRRQSSRKIGFNRFEGAQKRVSF
jgi:hypothetical protein